MSRKPSASGRPTGGPYDDDGDHGDRGPGGPGAAGFPQNREKIGKGHPPRHSQFKPQNRANPGGRPKGLVRKIRQLTDDGVALAVFMYEVWQGKITPTDSQFKAATWLAEHGFGRPQPLDMPPVSERPPLIFMFTKPEGYDPLAKILPAPGAPTEAVPPQPVPERFRDLEVVDPDAIIPLPDPPRRWPR